jgi:hypothetical protein
VLDAEPPEGDPRYPTVPSSILQIDVDARSERYVANSIYGGVEVQRLAHGGQGSRISAFTTQAPGPGRFEGRPRVASDGRGNVHVADAAERVQRFTDGFQLVGQWGQRGTEPGRFMSPQALTTDASGDVWVMDEGGEPMRVQHFKPSAELVDEIVLPRDQSHDPVAVAFDAAGRLYAITGGKIYEGWVRVYSRAGATVASSSLRYSRGRVKVRIRCAGSDARRGTVRLTANGSTVGSRRYRAAAGKTTSVAVRPGRRVLARARKVTVTVAPSHGAPTRKTLRLRR